MENEVTWTCEDFIFQTISRRQLILGTFFPSKLSEILAQHHKNSNNVKCTVFAFLTQKLERVKVRKLCYAVLKTANLCDCRFFCCSFSCITAIRTSFLGSPLGLNPWVERSRRQRHLLQGDDHSGNFPRLIPGFLRSCSEMFLEHFRIAPTFVHSENNRQV